MQLFSQEPKETMRAKADMTGEGISGQAEFIEYQAGTGLFVKLVLDIQSSPDVLKPGFHAVHIHEKPFKDNDFKSAGGHFDPGPAGNTDPDVNHPYHAGDFPNIEIGADGNGRLEAITTRVTLSEGLLSVFTGEGTSLMLHGNHDPYHGGEHGSGVSGGPRLACGNIEKA